LKQIDIENQLRAVVSRLMTEVELATKQGRFDLNLISEDAWIPILKEVYQCPNLINLNKKHKNFPGIDLGDEQDRVAFQVTSSTDIDKVKSTLEQFKKRNYKNAFDELYIFVLRSKQKRYSQDAIDKVIGDDIRFDAKEHIVDPGDVLAVITGLRLTAQERLLQEFKTILGDVESSLQERNKPENAPYVLVSNLLEVAPPKTLFVAELCIDENSVIAAAVRDLNYKGKRPITSFNVNWSKQQNQFYFLPSEKDSELRREEWVGKKQSKRRVFEKKYQTKDPTKVAFFKHLAFEISFIDIDSQWYATVTPSWFYTWNLYKRNRFHDDLLSKQKRLEHNHSVRDQVRFVGYFLANNCNENDLIAFGELVEFHCLSNISLEENGVAEEVLEEEVAIAD